MSVRIRVSSGLFVLFAAVAVLSGCGVSAEENIVAQDTQLKEAIAQADTWGGEITAQIPVTEIEPESDAHNIGGVRKTSDYGAEWPKYYYWAQIVELKQEGAMTPTQVADDLAPWLESQGWERNADSEFSPGKESFERDYYRDGYHLVVEVYTEPPPRAQSLHFTIMTPATDPDRR